MEKALRKCRFSRRSGQRLVAPEEFYIKNIVGDGLTEPDKIAIGVFTMRIFVSHASNSKPHVKMILRNLPANISTWLDESNLVWGDQLAPTFEKAIKTEADYVVLFVTEQAGRSEWVHKEVKWALEREQEVKRTFVLPVFLRSEGDYALDYFPELRDRKNIQVFEYTDLALRMAAEQLTSNLFSLICEDLSRMQNPAPMKLTQTLSMAEEMITSLAAEVQTVIFPHRRENPISVEKLCEILCKDAKNSFTPEDFSELMDRIVQRNLIPGLAYDGYELYLVEEHSRWKAQMNHENKVRIARKAASFIRSGMTVYIDAGSTTEEVIKILCKRVEMHTLSRITIVTPSVHHAEDISSCCVNLGLDDDSSDISLYIPGGYVRPSTQAIVPIQNQTDELDALAKQLGGYDLTIIGANGISPDSGLTTHRNREVAGKMTAFANGKKRIIVCDDSKLGIVLEQPIAKFDEDILMISNSNPVLAELQNKYPEHIILV